MMEKLKHPYPILRRNPKSLRKLKKFPTKSLRLHKLGSYNLPSLTPQKEQVRVVSTINYNGSEGWLFLIAEELTC